MALGSKPAVLATAPTAPHTPTQNKEPKKVKGHIMKSLTLEIGAHYKSAYVSI
jgi:hypothetical protein